MTTKPGAPERVDTVTPPRNFTLPTEELLRAYTLGVPAFARRRRQMEALEQQILARLATLRAKLGDNPAAESLRRAGEDCVQVQGDLARLNDLVDRHNRFYPAEANLPMDPVKRIILEGGEPWRPLSRVTLDLLIDRLSHT